MTTFRKAKLKDIATVLMGQSPQSIYCNETNEGMPLLNGPTEFGSRSPLAVQFTTDPKRVAKQGDLLFCVRGSTTGRMNWADREYAIGRGLAAIRPIGGFNLSSYLKAVIDNNLKNLLSQATGSTFPNISKDQLNDLNIVSLPIETQSLIASVLSAYDDLIENNEKRIKALEEMAQLLYTEWFVKFKFPGHEKVKMVDSGTEYGLIPEGWEVKKIQYLYETSSGGTPSRKNEAQFYNGGTIPWIKTKELNDNYILDAEEKITEFAVKKSSAKIFPKDTVLIAMYGATIGKLGILSSEAATNQACCAFLLRDKTYSSFYIFQFLKNSIKKITSLAFGAAQPNISQTTVKNIDIIAPSIEVLELYNQKSESIFGEIFMLQKQIKNLSFTRDLLIPQLVTGKRELK